MNLGEMRELGGAWVAGFGHVALISFQTYNIVDFNWVLAGLTSILLTVCWIKGIHAVLKTRLHKIVYGVGAVSGVECAMMLKHFIL